MIGSWPVEITLKNDVIRKLRQKESETEGDIR